MSTSIYGPLLSYYTVRTVNGPKCVKCKSASPVNVPRINLNDCDVLATVFVGTFSVCRVWLGGGGGAIFLFVNVPYIFEGQNVNVIFGELYNTLRFWPC